ncbi:MAG: glutamate racemase [Chitinophagales bacterium]|nr:glutamate racemase [Chitinophagales bacterium]
MDAQNPIGIFDSGIGGLTVANAILALLPKESLIYFGDTAHLPYGDKSADAIKSYAKNITEFLLKHKVKMIVIACNTASAHAYHLVQNIAKDIPVINVIEPVVNYILDKQYKKVGIIGTQGTVNSKVYLNQIQEKSNTINAVQLATPLLAPMIESGFVNGEISHLVIEEYLSDASLQNIDSLILACTHYPLIKKEIEAYYKSKNLQVEVLATNEIVAQYVKQFAIENGLVNYNNEFERKFFVSDYTQSFEKTTQLFYGKTIHLKQEKL